MTETEGDAAGEPFTWSGTPLLAGEVAAPAEMVQLFADPVYYGFGVPRGRGAPVLVLPGLLAGDLYLAPLRGWLRRIGYQPYESTLLAGVGCPDDLGRRLIERTVRVAAASGQQVAIVGHSLGGLLARGIAAARPDLVAGVMTLGAPFAGNMRVHPFTEGMVAVGRQGLLGLTPFARPDTCSTAGCTCATMRGFRAHMPLGVPFTSIYSQTDGVVFWRNCLDGDSANNVEVAGTHCGLAFNAQVYRHLARLLARLAHAPLRAPQRKV